MGLKQVLSPWINHHQLLLAFGLLLAAQLLPVEANSSNDENSHVVASDNDTDKCVQQCIGSGQASDACAARCVSHPSRPRQLGSKASESSPDGSAISSRKVRAAPGGGGVLSAAGAKKPATFIRVGKAAARGSFVRIGRLKPDVEQLSADDSETDSNCVDSDDALCTNDVTKRRSNNNFVRIGRRVTDELDDNDFEQIDKKAKQAFVRIGRKASANFVRIGRPGFVRIGKSSSGSSSPEVFIEKEDGLEQAGENN